MCGVKEGSARVGGDIFDAIFGAAVLVMGVDTTEGKGLVGGGDRRAESGGIEEAVIGMVVTDGDAVLGAEAFEGLFGLDGGLGGQFRHKVDVSKVRKMVNKDGSAGVAGRGRGAAVSRDKTWA